jgi:hypothetical protein
MHPALQPGVTSASGNSSRASFRSVIVDREGYLLELCRYVVPGPVHAGMMPLPEGCWSSCCTTAGLDAGVPWLRTAWTLEQFGSSPALARARYREFVREGSAARRSRVRERASNGSRQKIDKRADVAELPKCQRLPYRMSLAEVLRRPSGRPDCDATGRRGAPFWTSSPPFGDRAAPGLHYATISRITRQVECGNTRPDPGRPAGPRALMLDGRG